MTPDNDTVMTPPTTDAPEQWREVTVEWSLDGDAAVPEHLDLRTPREGCQFDPDNPYTWAFCQTPGCGDELDYRSGRFTDGTMDYDVVHCPSCDYQEHV